MRFLACNFANCHTLGACFLGRQIPNRDNALRGAPGSVSINSMGQPGALIVKLFNHAVSTYRIGTHSPHPERHSWPLNCHHPLLFCCRVKFGTRILGGRSCEVFFMMFLGDPKIESSLDGLSIPPSGDAENCRKCKIWLRIVIL